MSAVTHPHSKLFINPTGSQTYDLLLEVQRPNCYAIKPPTSSILAH